MEIRINAIEVDTKDLVPNTWNYNEQTEFMQGKLGKSLEKFGQVAEILVRESGDKYETIDGEHRYK